MPRGVEHGRVLPSGDLAWLVEHFWWVSWDLEEPAVSEVLSYPSIHVVLEGGDVRAVGVQKQKFARRLEGRGEVLGIKVRPGMFATLTGAPAWPLTNRSVPLREQLVDPSLEAAFRVPGHPRERVACIEEALRQRRVQPSERPLLACNLVERIRSDRELTSVAALARVSGFTGRALQRLFRDFVGVTPKWVVRRFRLQEAAVLLTEPGATVASVAVRLGYFDQAHFVHDFTAVVGQTPVEFARSTRAASSR